MTKRSTQVGTKLKNARISANGYYNPTDLHKCRQFLNESLHNYIEILNKDQSQEGIIQTLELVEKISRRLATLYHQCEPHRQKKLSDSDILFEEIENYTNSQLLKLKHCIDEALSVIKNINTYKIQGFNHNKSVHVRCNNTECGNIRTLNFPSWTKQAEDFSHQLETLTHPQKTAVHRTKGNKPLRKAIINSLMEAWIEITNTPPEPLNRDRQKEQFVGKFSEFMKKGLALFNIGISLECAIKESWASFINQFAENMAINISRKNIGTMTWETYQEQGLKLIAENKLSPAITENLRKAILSTLSTYWKKDHVDKLEINHN